MPWRAASDGFLGGFFVCSGFGRAVSFPVSAGVSFFWRGVVATSFFLPVSVLHGAKTGERPGLKMANKSRRKARPFMRDKSG